MKDSYRDGFDYGCVRSREESISLGILADMTFQELVNYWNELNERTL